MINQITSGNARDLASLIPSKSISLIFSDPVYDQLNDYIWLAQEAIRLLKDDGNLLVYCSNRGQYKIQAAMAEYLDFVLPLQYIVVAKPSRLFDYHCFVWATPCLWFRKGKGKPRNWTIDTVISHAQPNGAFKWNKNPEAYSRWIEDFSQPGETIFDPFTGSGTIPAVCKGLARKWIAFEIDKERAIEAQQRVDATTAGFPVHTQPQQPALFKEANE